MVIERITIRHYGDLDSWETEFHPDVTVIGSHYSEEIACAITCLLCGPVSRTVSRKWVKPDTCLTAVVTVEGRRCTVCATPEKGRLRLSAVDPSGSDVTAWYRHTLAHCLEQGIAERFDGTDKTIPQRLQRYRYQADHKELSRRTCRLTDTQMFRDQVLRYIRSFQSEPLPTKTNYQIVMNPRGVFEVKHAHTADAVWLSESDEKLFLYSCFLRVAEFWDGIEHIRDLHYEKKPLMIRNFLEFLDESVCKDELITAVRKLQRQIILLTTPSSRDFFGT